MDRQNIPGYLRNEKHKDKEYESCLKLLIPMILQNRIYPP